MKKGLIFATLAMTATTALAQGSHSTRGYVRNDGTYVAPHMSTNPNSNRVDNWSSRPNVNPYTGRTGTVDPFTAPRPTTTYSPPAYRPYRAR